MKQLLFTVIIVSLGIECLSSWLDDDYDFPSWIIDNDYYFGDGGDYHFYWDNYKGYEDSYDYNSMIDMAALNNFIPGKTVGGLWQDSHAEQMMTPSQMSQFEMGLQFTPSVNKELKKLKCGTNFIRKMFVNVQNPTESILQVLCQNQEWYLWMQGMPPETSRVVAYPFDPILN